MPTLIVHTVADYLKEKEKINSTKSVLKDGEFRYYDPSGNQIARPKLPHYRPIKEYANREQRAIQ